MPPQNTLLKLILLLLSGATLIIGVFIFQARLSILKTKTLPLTPPVRIVPHTILGQGHLKKEQWSALLLQVNSRINSAALSLILDCYLEEAAREQINHDIALAQMILETGYLKYGGVVLPEQNNFAGLGAINAENRGLSFNTIKEGIRAHIQHLKAYASQNPLNGPCIDPRFMLVTRGSAPTIFNLSGKWATDSEYGEKIYRILWRIYLMGE